MSIELVSITPNSPPSNNDMEKVTVTTVTTLSNTAIKKNKNKMKDGSKSVASVVSVTKKKRGMESYPNKHE